MAGLNVKDKRIKARVIKVLESIAKSPQSSLPQACLGWSDTLAAYRLFDNDAVSSDDLIQAHYEATEQRIRASGSDVILCIQDTTEFRIPPSWISTASRSRGWGDYPMRRNGACISIPPCA